MQLLNIYEYYYTFYSWYTYEAIYQTLWATKIILLPFVLFIFQMMKTANEETGGKAVNFRGNAIQFLVMVIVFLTGAVPTVPLKVNDTLINFIECDIQVKPQDFSKTTTFLESDTVKMPLIPYLLYAVGSGLNSSVGNTLTCMQSVAAGIEATTTGDLRMEGYPDLAEMHKTYLSSCHHKVDSFVPNFVRQLGFAKSAKLHSEYKGLLDFHIGSGVRFFKDSQNFFNFGANENAAGAIAAFKSDLMTNNKFLTDIVYAGNAQDTIHKINEVGKKTLSVKFGDGFEYQTKTWTLSPEDENWIRKNIPLVMKVSKSDADYMGGSSLGARALSLRYDSGSSACEISPVEESEGVACYSCERFGKAVLDLIAEKKLTDIITAQIQDSRNNSSYTHPIIVKPTKANAYNEAIRTTRLTGSKAEQRFQLSQILNDLDAGQVVSGFNFSIDKNGELQPKDQIQNLAKSLLESSWASEKGFLTATETNPHSIIGGERDNFVGAKQVAAIGVSAIASKGGNIIELLNTWVKLDITKSMMLQIIPMVLMLYILFWLPYMIFSMYTPTALLKGSAIFFAIRLTPLLTTIIASTSNSILSLLDYGSLDAALLESASSMLIIALPVIILGFLSAAFGSSLSGAVMGAGASMMAASSALKGGQMPQMKRKKPEKDDKDDDNKKD